MSEEIERRKRLIVELTPELIDDPGAVEFLVHMPEAQELLADCEAARLLARAALKRVYESAGYKLPESSS